MAKKRPLKNGGIRYKESGKDDYPGQLSFDIGDKAPTLYEDRPHKCSQYQAKMYWRAFDRFLSASGKFSMTWELHEAIRTDPDIEELENEPEYESPYLRKKRLERLEAAKFHLWLMTTTHRCYSLDELKAKAKREWEDFREALDSFEEAAKAANVPLNVSEQYKRKIMVCFESAGKGACRREFYRREVRKATDQLSENSLAYIEPISMQDLEESFKKASEFRASFKERKKKARENEHKTRKKRLNGEKTTSPPPEQ